MVSFETMTLPAGSSVLAPDGSEVRVLLQLAGGSMAHFRLQPGQTSIAVAHRSVEELWYVVSGRGEMWRSEGGRESKDARLPGRVSASRPARRFSSAAPATSPSMPWP